MKLLEYQAKAELARAGIAVPEGRLARSPAEARAAADLLGPVAVKAQVPVGGRGKAGGIRLARTPDEAEAAASAILAMEVRGYGVPAVWCEQLLDIAGELYGGITVDRDRRRMAVMLSLAGGVDIEAVAATSPGRIARLWPDPFAGPLPFELRRLVLAACRGQQVPAGLRPIQLAALVVPVLRTLYDVASRLDATLCEVNPLVVTADGRLVAGDAKLEIDPGAEFRHPDLAAAVAADGAAAVSGEDPLEVAARERGLTYVHLGGDIGVVGNGAGLVMNTLDLVKQHGGEPANFLDIGGGARAEVVTRALLMVALDPAVRGIFVNIFGGITRGDEVARGVIAARDAAGITVPLVVRMTGTRELEGRQLLEAAGIVPTATAPEAALAIVQLARDRTRAAG
ncbi:MAG TPA: ADP-forming succinate--CoA ligase subunit beta [Candidatus Micrarchaeia archaeon]|nr:ADP-forming succinate--CoA ligase subunit beta [Candidatus Micrarchaeia archaeon]